jgi:hypothetical protein
MIALVLISLVVLPVAWLISEFQRRVWIRLTLGVLSLALSFFVAWVVGELSHFQYNSSYGFASSQLIDAVIANIEAGNEEGLLRELRQLKTDYKPTYENRANYDELVERFAERLKTKTGQPPLK